MRREVFEAIGPICPTCRGEERAYPLALAWAIREEDGHVIEGVIQCTNPHCYREYPIVDGVPMLVAGLRSYMSHSSLGVLARDDLSPDLMGLLGDSVGPNSAFDVLRQHNSQYASDHYGDLDPDAAPVDRDQAGSAVRLLNRVMPSSGVPTNGPILDLGCSVGRTTFELAAKSEDWVIGADLNFSMLRVASRVLRTGRVTYPRRRVGVVYDACDYEVDLPGRERVDFWQIDAMNPPFPWRPFSMMTSIHVLDCLPSPLGHLQSLDGLVREGGCVILATPFDWSPTATALENWIGGHGQRTPEAGRSELWLRRTIEGFEGRAGLGWSIESTHEVEWTVRLHERSRMTYQSHVLVLRR